MMKLRAKANGNVVIVPDSQGEALLASGIYEPITMAEAIASTPDIAQLTENLLRSSGRPPPKRKAKA